MRNPYASCCLLLYMDGGMKSEHEDRSSPFSNNCFRVFGLHIFYFRNSGRENRVRGLYTKKTKGVFSNNPTLAEFPRD